MCIPNQLDTGTLIVLLIGLLSLLFTISLFIPSIVKKLKIKHILATRIIFIVLTIVISYVSYLLSQTFC